MAYTSSSHAAMTLAPSSMTRSSSAISSTLSNIDVAVANSDDAGLDAATPPTSVSDGMSQHSIKAEDEPAAAATTTATTTTTNSPSAAAAASTSSRPQRARASVPSYNDKQNSRASRGYASIKPAAPRRSVSGLTGRTLVDGGSVSPASAAANNDADDDDDDVIVAVAGPSPSFGDRVNSALDLEWEIPVASPRARRSPVRAQRSASVRERVKAAAGKVGSVLGKRTREVVEAGKRKMGLEKEEKLRKTWAKKNKKVLDPKQQRILRELDTGKRGVLDEMDLDVDYIAPPRPTKRPKTTHPKLQEIPQPIITGPLQKTSDGKKVKKWQAEGLYVGQDERYDPLHVGATNSPKKRAILAETETNAASTSFLRLPLFNYLDKTRSFTIPYDIYAPSLRRGDEKPKDWKMLNRNRLIGEAKDLWEEDRLPASACVCPHPAPGEQGCEDSCLNRVMQYECNDDNCRLPASVCSNRAFAELQARKEKGGSYDVGVEVIKTHQCGFGVRAARSFAPGQIIMEYTGEIISEAECQRRMREVYNDKKCYYLMELERNLVIDGTKGSMARFINHSCEPNCEVRMVKVNGAPRMAVFAGESGIMTGEELSYDYNFDNFGNHQQACHCGARTCRGYLGKRLNAAEQKKQAKLAEERKRKAAEEAQKLAAAEERRKKVRTSRGSNWRGWVAVDDADVKLQLREEKRLKDEAARTSDRALRMAARRSVAAAAASSPGRAGAAARRAAREANLASPPTRTSPRKNRLSAPLPMPPPGPIRTTSTGSRFSEDLPRSKPRRRTTSSAAEALPSINVQHPLISSAQDESDDDDDENNEEARAGDARKKAASSKSLLSSVSNAVKNSFSGSLKANLGTPSNGKLRQSTLGFARMG